MLNEKNFSLTDKKWQCIIGCLRVLSCNPCRRANEPSSRKGSHNVSSGKTNPRFRGNVHDELGELSTIADGNYTKEENFDETESVQDEHQLTWKEVTEVGPKKRKQSAYRL